MHPVSSKQLSGTADLRQHFHNYFELLLAFERSRLHQAANSIAIESDRPALLAEIECRMHYLQGAVKMGKLLCLIDQEEAKSNFAQLSTERDRLRSTVLGKTPQPSTSANGLDRLTAIRRSLHIDA